MTYRLFLEPTPPTPAKPWLRSALSRQVCWLYQSVLYRIVANRCRNINLLCITYSLRPRLSSRLTLGGRTLPRKPYPYGEPDFNRLYRYLCLHSHFQALHVRFPLHFAALRTLSYRDRLATVTHSFGIQLESRSFSAQLRSMGQLLRTV